MDGRPTTTAYPCDHCLLCDFHAVCEEGWERDDRLTRVANIRSRAHRGEGRSVRGHGATSAASPRLASATPHALDRRELVALKIS